MVSWKETRTRLTQDKQRILAYAREARAEGINWPTHTWAIWFHPGYQCVILHRLSHFFFSNGHRIPARILWHLNCILTGADISPNTDIGGGLLIKSPIRVTAVGKAGINLTIDAHGGFGGGRSADDIGAGPGLPIVSDGVSIGYGAMILGPVHIGSNVVLEARASVGKNIPDNTRVTLVQKTVVEGEKLSETEAATNKEYGVTKALSLFATLNQDILQYIRYSSAFSGDNAGVLRKLSALLTPSMMCVLLFRLSHVAHRWRLPGIPVLIAKLNFLLHRASLSPASRIGPGLYIPHTSGVVFHGVAGRNLVLYYHAVVVAQQTHLDKTRLYNDCPILGDDVLVGSAAVVKGGVCIGDGCVVGINGAVSSSLENNTSVITRETIALQPIEDGADVDRQFDAAVGETKGEDWHQTRQLIKQDWSRLRCFFEQDGVSPPWYFAVSSPFQAVLLFRLSRYCWTRGFRRLGRFLWHVNLFYTGVDINPNSVIGGGLVMANPTAINIAARIGRNCTLGDGIGLTPVNGSTNWPSVGDDVCIGEGAIVAGAVNIGNAAVVSAKCLVDADLQPGSRMSPAAAIHKRYNPANAA